MALKYLSFFLLNIFMLLSCADQNRKVEININLPEKISAIKESIRVSSDSPDVLVTHFDVLPNSTGDLRHDYDVVLGDISVIDKLISLRVFLSGELQQKIKLVIGYQDKNTKKFFNEVVSVKPEIEPISSELPDNSCNNMLDKPVSQDDQANPAVALHANPKPESLFAKISNYIDLLVTKSNSLWIQLIAVFFLGILMSLTPCIYPMIPITAGILQSYGSKSMWHNIAVSLLYALGIATTFSIFGLISASTGVLFGNLLVNPIFILILVGFLAYMGLTMIGVVNFYTPNFMQASTSVKKRGIFSAFIFGVISGSVASPCLTPGLALLLTIVATLGNKFLGLVLLFTAGLGLSLPLLIVGMFSSSLSVLPRAGMWMIEVKRIFGFILFGMCFYFLGKIMPHNYFYILLSLFLFVSGVYYFASIKKHDTKNWKLIKNIIGLLFIIFSVVTLTQIFFVDVQNQALDESWETDLTIALKDGIVLKKPIFIDFTGEFCSICKAIEKKILQVSVVKNILDKRFIKLKIDASKDEKTFKMLQEKYNIIGVPTLLVIDPSSMKEIARWGSKVYSKSAQDFAQELQALGYTT